MIMLLVGTSPANFTRIRACGGVLFLSQDTVIIYGNSWTGNNVSFWTLKGGRNTLYHFCLLKACGDARPDGLIMIK